MRPVVLKLGGSAITEKSRKCTPNLPVLERAVEHISRFDAPLILLHGGGSFAHPFVTAAGLQKGHLKPSQLVAISETEFFLDQLTRIIGANLLLKNKPFVPMHPMNFLTTDNGRVSKFFLEPIEKALEFGLVPLIHGDLAFDSLLGCGVVSADKLASFLGKKLSASRVLFGCDVDGIYSKDPKTHPDAKLVEEVIKRDYAMLLRALRGSSYRDATGGMLGKAIASIELAKSGVEVFIFNMTKPANLGDALKGRPCGTRFIPNEKVS